MFLYKDFVLDSMDIRQQLRCEDYIRRILAPDQDKALHDDFVQLDKIGMPARLHLIEQAAKSVLRMSVGPGTPQRHHPKSDPSGQNVG